MQLRIIAAVSVASVLAACSSCNEDTATPSATVEKPNPSAPRDDTSFRIPVAGRLVAFGDVHGDVAATKAALRLAGAIDADDHWNGGKLTVVQTGDQLDRGNEEPEILDLFQRLRGEAKKAGGAFVALDGNHEVMNVAGDFRYVTEDGFHDFEGTTPSGSAGDTLPAERKGRAFAFAPGGPMARRLAEQPVVVVAGDTVFAHGGVLPAHVSYGIGRINSETRKWMLGESKGMPRILAGDSAPIWTRVYSDGEVSTRVCDALGHALDELHAKRMVVGHTVQKSSITSACADRVWRIDVGLAAFYGGKPAVLEIDQGKVRVITSAAIMPDSAQDRAR